MLWRNVLIPFSGQISTLKMEVVYSSKILVNIYHATWHRIPEDSSLQSLLCEPKIKQPIFRCGKDFYLTFKHLCMSEVGYCILQHFQCHRLHEYSIKWQDDRRNVKDLEESGHGLIVEVSQDSPGVTEENYETLSGQSVSWLRFEPSTSQIQIKGVSSKPTCLVPVLRE